MSSTDILLIVLIVLNFVQVVQRSRRARIILETVKDLPRRWRETHK